MIVPLILALLLPLSPACAAEGQAAEAALAIESADADLLGLEKDLAGKLEQKNNATLKPEDYQGWAKEFRTRLAAVIERVPPSADNQAAHARIMAIETRHLAGVDKFGSQWYSRLLADGKQILRSYL